MTPYTHKLRYLYIFALSMVALLTVGEHWLLASMDDNLSNEGAVINVAAKQRMLSQRIASLSQQIHSHMVADEAQQALAKGDLLQQEVSVWKTSHLSLVARSESLGLGGRNSREIQDGYSRLQASHDEAVSLAEALVRQTRRPMLEFNAIVSLSRVDAILEQTDAYMPVMNRIVNMYEDSLADHTTSLQDIQTTAAAITLIVLLGQAFFIYEPAIRRLRRQSLDLVSLRSAIDNHTLFSVTDPKGTIIDINEGFCRINGYTRDELLGQNHRILNSGMHDRRFWVEMWQTITAGKSWRGEVCNKTKGGDIYWVDSTNIPQYGPKGEIERFISLRFDITDKKMAEAAMERAEHRLDAQRSELQGIIDAIPGFVYYKDDKNTILDCNEAAAKSIGLPREIIRNRKTEDFFPAEDAAAYLEDDKAVIASGKPRLGIIENYESEGTSRLHIRTDKIPLRGPSGEFDRLVAIATDITDLVNATDKIKETEERFELAIAGSKDAIFDWTLADDHIYYSSRWQELLHRSEKELAPTLDTLLKNAVPEDAERLEKELAEFVRGGSENFESELQMTTGDGSTIWVLMRAASFRDDQGVATRVAGSVADITNLKTAQEEMERLVQQDHLTGLASRSRFTERLDHAVKRCKRTGMHVGVLFFDFDRFKVVNDSLGHDVGDELLCSIADRLRDNIREVDTPARFGGDEFVILLEDLPDTAAAKIVADKLLKACAAPHPIRSHNLVSTASIGLVTTEKTNASPNELLQYADAAMYEAKRRGRDCVVEFDREMFAEQIDRAELEEDLQGAIENEQLELFFQPIIDLDTGDIVYAESLIRWHHPKRGLVPPDRFIPIAEESKLIVPIGEWVIDSACRQLADWRERGTVGEDFALSVNVSKVELMTPGFPAALISRIDAHGLPRTSIKIEVTETTIVDNRSDVSSVLDNLRSQSIVVMMDDFGTGHSSLSGLHKLPIDELKIDQSFISNADSNTDLIAITSSIVSLADHLSLRTIGEGIETPEHIAILQTMGCMYGQGYFWSRPVPAPEFEAYLAGKTGGGDVPASVA